MAQRTLQERIEDIFQQKGNPLTSVVLLSFNRKEDLEANIASLYETTQLPFEVVIWDNGSDQETVQYLRGLEGRTKADGNGQIKVFYSGVNLGCSGGRREAIKQAKGNWIYTVDNDMTYTPNWLEAIIDRVERDPKIGAANSKIVYPNGNIQLNGGVLILEENYFGSFVQIDEGKSQFDPNIFGEMECDWLCGGATLLKREVAAQVEHAPGYLNGFEDYDYSFQISNLGYRVVNCPESTVVHHHIGFDRGKQEREQSYLRSRWSSERLWASMVYFLERTGINMVKTSSYFNWIERDGTKPFLKWGQVGDIKFEYEDLFPGRALNQLTNEEIRRQFDSIVAKNMAIRAQIGDTSSSSYLSKVVFTDVGDVVQSLAPYMAGAFSKYNLHNLAGHLDWVMSGVNVNGNHRLSGDDIQYLADQFKFNVTEADSRKANLVYDMLKRGLSRLVI